MSTGWRSTMRMATTALAAAAVNRAAGSVRRFLDEQPPRAAAARPEPLHYLDAPAPLTTGAPAAPSTPGVQHLTAAQSTAHDFGPTPAVVPSRGIGFRPEPSRRVVQPAAEMPIISRPHRSEPDEPATEPEPVLTAASIVHDLRADDPDDADADDQDLDVVKQVAEAAPEADVEIIEPAVVDPVAEEPPPAPEPEPVPDVVVAAAPLSTDVPIGEPVVERAVTPAPRPKAKKAVKPEKAKESKKAVKPEKAKKSPKPESAPVESGPPAKHRRHRSAISGTIRSSRGRGLRGLQLVVVDDDNAVVGTTTSGPRGEFFVDGLPAGRYRVRGVDDVEGDFETAWLGGRSFKRADVVKVKKRSTRRKAVVTVVSLADVQVRVSSKRRRTKLSVQVLDRSTATPADGTVRITTAVLGVDLPLVDGRARLTLRTPKGAPKRPHGKRVTVEYRGSRHTRPGTATAKLR